MSWWSARLFAQVQSASFYRQLHSDAVDLLPPGAGRRWIDVGCGPGLVTRLATQRGYASTGLDLDPAMVTLAKRLHPTTLAPGAYARESVFDVADRWPAAAVVSAASLLAVLPDRALALDALCRALQPSGTLLLIEPSQTMGPEAAAAYLASHPQEPKAWVLQLWARTRLQERAVQSKDLIHPELELSCHPLLGGMVNAWVLSKRPVSN